MAENDKKKKRDVRNIAAKNMRAALSSGSSNPAENAAKKASPAQAQATGGRKIPWKDNKEPPSPMSLVKGFIRKGIRGGVKKAFPDIKIRPIAKAKEAPLKKGQRFYTQETTPPSHVGRPQKKPKKKQSLGVIKVTGAKANLGPFESAAEAEAQFARNRERLFNLRLQNQAWANQQAAFDAGETDISPNMRGYVAPGEQPRRQARGGGQGFGFQKNLQQADRQLQALSQELKQTDDPHQRGAIRHRMRLISDTFGIGMQQRGQTGRTGMQQEGETRRQGMYDAALMAREGLRGQNYMARQQQEQQFMKQNPQLFGRRGPSGGLGYKDVLDLKRRYGEDAWNAAMDEYNKQSMVGGEKTFEEILRGYQSLSDKRYNRAVGSGADNFYKQK